MGMKKGRGDYNDFLDGEKLRDNTEVRTTLQVTSSLTRDVSPPPTRTDRKGKGRRGKRGPQKQPLTHFLCLPLTNEGSKPQLQNRLDMFKQLLEKEVLVSLKAVRPVGTLHLTLGVMSLNSDRLEGAKECLQKLDLRKLLWDITAAKVAEKAAEDGEIAENLNAAALPDSDAISIDLKSLVPMQASHKTTILYAEPDDASQRLYPFGTALRNHFTEQGFLVEDKRALKLHATIINTIYAKPGGRRGQGRHGKNKRAKRRADTATETTEQDQEQDDLASVTGSTQEPDHEAGGEEVTAPPDPPTTEKEVPASKEQVDHSESHGPNAKSWMRFDATSLIEKYKDFRWAENVRIDRVQICKMGAKKIWSGERDGEGEIVAEEYEVVEEKPI